MKRLLVMAILILFGIIGSGCSLMAPKYTASIDNIQRLKDAGEFAAKVGKFDSSSEKSNANPISLRGSSLSSPYEDSYAAYLAEATNRD